MLSFVTLFSALLHVLFVEKKRGEFTGGNGGATGEFIGGLVLAALDKKAVLLYRAKAIAATGKSTGT